MPFFSLDSLVSDQDYSTAFSDSTPTSESISNSSRYYIYGMTVSVSIL